MNNAWRCDSCDTNNEPDATDCRVCGLVPGSAAGLAQQVTEAFVPGATTAPAPEFGQSKHAHFQPRSQRQVPAMPPPIVLPPPLPRTEPKSSHGASVFVGFMIVAVLTVIIAVLVQFEHSKGASPSSNSGSYDTGELPTPLSGSDEGAVPYDAQPTNQQPTGPACPDAVAEYLPDSGSDSVLMAAYTSTEYTVTLCQADNGQLYYDGQVIGEAPSDTTHISIPAQQTPDGYTAFNNGYTYDIEGSDEKLIFGGRIVKEFAITRTGP